MRTDYLSMEIDETKRTEEEFAKLISKFNKDLGCIASCKIRKVTDKDTGSSRFIAEIISLSTTPLGNCSGVLNLSEIYDDIFPLCKYLDINPECGLKLSESKIQALHHFYKNGKNKYESMNQFVPFMHYADIYDFEKFVNNHFEFYDANKNEIQKGCLHGIELKGNSIKSNYFSTLEYLVDWLGQRIKWTEFKDVNKDFGNYFSTFMSIEDIFSFIGSVEQSACIEYLLGIDEGIFAGNYKINQFTNPYNVAILRKIGETGYNNGDVDNIIAMGFDYNQLKAIKNACELSIPDNCIDALVCDNYDPIAMEGFVYAVNYLMKQDYIDLNKLSIILKSNDPHKVRLMVESVIDRSFDKMEKYFKDGDYNILQLKIIKMTIDDGLEVLCADKLHSAVDMFFLYLANKNISNEPIKYLGTDEIKELISNKILSDINKFKPKNSAVNFITDYIIIDLDKIYMDWEQSFVDSINRSDSIQLIDTDTFGYKDPEFFIKTRNCKEVLKF